MATILSHRLPTGAAIPARRCGARAALDLSCRHQLPQGRTHMPKGYWIACYREITHPDKLSAYAKLAAPAIEAGGGKFLARGTAAQAYEAGLRERTVLIEFASVEQAIATHDSAGYRAALAALAGGAVRDLRIVAGI